MNIKKQYSIRDFGIPSVFSGTNILNTVSMNDTKYWVINGQRTNITANPNLETSANNIPEALDGTLALLQGVDASTFQRNLELLNQRINAVHKELTYWDLYKLTASVDNAEDLESTFSGLSIGQSMVINCPTFSKGGVTYSRGDVIVRTSENKEIKIDALATGLFYPKKVNSLGGNLYSIEYSYYGGQPVDEGSGSESQTINVGQSVSTANGLPRRITVQGLSDSAGTIYGQFFLINELTPFDVLYENGDSNTAIRPIIKVFTDEHEEISLDSRTISISMNPAVDDTPAQWEITFNQSVPVAAYVQVK